MERFTILNRPTLQQNTFVFYISKNNDPVRIISILKIPPWPNLMYRSSQTFNIQIKIASLIYLNSVSSLISSLCSHDCLKQHHLQPFLIYNFALKLYMYSLSKNKYNRNVIHYLLLVVTSKLTNKWCL